MEPVKIFLDTNIVIDYFSGRMNDNVAKTVVQIGRLPQFEMCISMLTAINVLYVARKYMPALKPENLSSIFTILPQDYGQYCDAIKLGMNDFEDAIQASCALHNRCLFAISRDPHFEVAPMVTFKPEEFIEAVRKQ